MSQATDMLAAYTAAEIAVLKGESYRIGDLMLTRANLAEIIAGRQEWQRAVNAEARTAAKQGPLSVHVSDFNHGHTPLGDGRGEFGWH
jgi:hypothetical protein